MLVGLQIGAGMGANTELPGITNTHFEYNNSVNNDSKTWTAVSIGNPNASRLVIVVISMYDGPIEDASSGRSVTIGGVSATEHLFHENVTTSDGTAWGMIFSRLVPTGLTTDIVATISGFSGVIDSWSIAAYRGVELTSNTPISTFGADAEPVILNTSGALAAMFAANRSGSAYGSNLWSGGGNTVDLGSNSTMRQGWDNAPLGGGTDNYSFSGSERAIVGACWG